MLDHMRSHGAKIGTNVKIERQAYIENYETFELDSNSRIDCFAFLTGKIKIGKFVHIPPFTILSGTHQITIQNAVTISAGVKIYTKTADYKKGLTNPTIPQDLRKSFTGNVIIENFACLFANTTVLPGVHIQEGAVFHSNSVVKSGQYKAWTIFHGAPAMAIRSRDKEPILEAWKKLMSS